ncbi:MAG: nitrous oxidase accessory protein [Puniceicoccaceae bacterium 5H]|nr:MAG: nitrous oxidase accessory protein [Puniceicoccaceae bacterium 5H]
MKRLFLCLALLATALPLTAATLQERIDAAAPGDVIEVAPGTYAGPLVIRQALTLRGHDWPLIEGDGQSSVIHIVGTGVTIEGFRIEHSGLSLSDDEAGVFIEGDRATVRDNRIQRVLHGIYVKGASYARLEENVIDGLIYLPPAHADVLQQGWSSRPTELCTVALDTARRGNGIHLWNSEGHQIRGNTIRNTRDGIYFSFTHHTWVYRNTVERVRYGLHYMYSDGNTFEENDFTQNAAGAAIMYSEGIRADRNRFFNNRGQRAYGLLLQSVDDSSFTRNAVTGNTIGLYLENSQRNLLEGNDVARNYVGVRFSATSADNRLTANRFERNLHPVELDQGERLNQWSVDGVGNVWGTAGSPDLDGDGVGDWPHYESDILGPKRREHALVGLVSGSAFTDLLRFVASRCRVSGLPVIEDPHPVQTNP